MGDDRKRQSFFRTNQYQKPIIHLAVLPTFIFCTLTSFFVLILHNELVAYVKFNTTIETVDVLNRWGWFIIVTIWTFFAVVCAWAQVVSGRMVGAFERVVRELDRVVDGEDVAFIKARDNDRLAGDLLKRVNVLIQRNRTIRASQPARPSMGRV